MKQVGASTVTGDGVLGGVGGALGAVDAAFAELLLGAGRGWGPFETPPDLKGLGTESLGTASDQPGRSVGEELSDALTAAADGVESAGQFGPPELVGVLDPGVVEALETVGRLRAGLDGVAVALAAEADLRGLHTSVGLSLVDWLRVRCPWMTVTEAGQVRTVVRAGQQHWGKDLLAGVAAGKVPVHRGAKVARTMTRLAGSLTPEQQGEYAAIATGAAGDREISDGDLEVVCRKLLIDLLDQKPKEERERAAQDLRCVSRRRLGTGMTRFTIDAPEADAALLDGVLTGPLAAPDPVVQEDGAEVDVRSPGQRKYDAVLMVINRGMSNPGAPPSSGRASVMITVKADPQTGKPVGAGVTALSQVLDARQVGRFACIGDVTPIVLGEHGEPLNLGRTVRLATPGQFKALMVRDQKCTYPGCSVPGTWCDAHHLVWWCRGGGTDIAFLVLLCPRHHTLVHSKDLMASVSGSVVTWHV